jgi:hypothetical protein
MPAVAGARKCPNCSAAIPNGARQCLVCKMEVSQMIAFAAAKEAARRRGVRKTEVEESAPPWWRQPMAITAMVVVALVASIIIWKVTRPLAPPWWTLFPTTQDDAVNQFMNGIAVGDDPGYDKSYALVAPSVKDPKDSDEQGKYRQLYHEMYKYLSIFGSHWEGSMKIEQDPTNSDLMLVHVGPETLHVMTSLQTPADKLTDANHHYAIMGIGEYDISQAASQQQMEGIKGFLRGEAGDAAVRNVESVLGAEGAPRHETPMQAKMRLIPLLHDPRTTNKYEIYQTWPNRKDPAMRWQLDEMTKDQRYQPDFQQTAQEVLDDKVTDEELIAAHVNDN